MPPPSRNNKRSPESPPTNDVGWKWWRKEDEWKNDWKWEEEWGDPGWDKNYGWRDEGPDHGGKEDEDDDVQVLEWRKEPIEVSDGEDDEPHPKKDRHDECTEDDTPPHDEGTEDETWGDWKPLPGAKPASGSGDVSNGPQWLESLDDEYPSWGGWIMSGLVDKKHVCF